MGSKTCIKDACHETFWMAVSLPFIGDYYIQHLDAQFSVHLDIGVHNANEKVTLIHFFYLILKLNGFITKNLSEISTEIYKN